MAALTQDLRYAIRLLVRYPGFSLVAVLALALGIGSMTSTFSVANAYLLRPLPFSEPERLVHVWETNRRQGWSMLRVSLPNFLDYFETVLRRNPGGYLLGKRVCYADLSLFQMVEGLRYAFPRAMARLERGYPRVMALHDRAALRPRLATYLASSRRIPFNQQGIFRRYPELDPV